MLMVAKLMYLMDIVSNMEIMVFSLFVFSLIMLIVFGLIFILGTQECWKDDDLNKQKNYMKKAFIASVICGFLLVLFPSKATMYTFVGATTIDAALETDVGKELTQDTKEIMKDVKTIVHNYLDEMKKGTKHENIE